MRSISLANVFPETISSVVEARGDELSSRKSFGLFLLGGKLSVAAVVAFVWCFGARVGSCANGSMSSQFLSAAQLEVTS